MTYRRQNYREESDNLFFYRRHALHGVRNIRLIPVAPAAWLHCAQAKNNIQSLRPAHSRAFRPHR